MYFVDLFSRLTRACIIRDENPSTVVKAILNTWVIGKGIGPGMPGKFLYDNGTEFNNMHMIDLCEKYSIPISSVTAAYAPFSNGSCERNHGITDLMIEKIKEGDPSISDQEALDYSLLAKNIQTTRKGFSPFQIVYGSNPRIPGIAESNLSGLSSSFESKDVKKHFERLTLARESFVKADTDDRLKRALKSRIPKNHNHFYYVGDSVFFKEEGSLEWKGPAKVLSVDGKVVFLLYGNKLRRVHITKLALNEREGFHSEDSKASDNENTVPDENEVGKPQNKMESNEETNSNNENNDVISEN